MSTRRCSHPVWNSALQPALPRYGSAAVRPGSRQGGTRGGRSSPPLCQLTAAIRHNQSILQVDRSLVDDQVEGCMAISLARAMARAIFICYRR